MKTPHCDTDHHKTCFHTSTTCECDCHHELLWELAGDIDFDLPEYPYTPEEWAEWARKIDTARIQRGKPTLLEVVAERRGLRFSNLREQRDEDVRAGRAEVLALPSGPAPAREPVPTPASSNGRSPADPSLPWVCSMGCKRFSLERIGKAHITHMHPDEGRIIHDPDHQQRVQAPKPRRQYHKKAPAPEPVSEVKALVWCDRCQIKHLCETDHGPDGHGGSSICCPVERVEKEAYVPDTRLPTRALPTDVLPPMTIMFKISETENEVLEVLSFLYSRDKADIAYEIFGGGIRDVERADPIIEKVRTQRASHLGKVSSGVHAGAGK